MNHLNQKNCEDLVLTSDNEVQILIEIKFPTFQTRKYLQFDAKIKSDYLLSVTILYTNRIALCTKSFNHGFLTE